MAGAESAFRLALESNKVWAEQTSRRLPQLFSTLSKGQSPPILWIGCADSRVPETTVLGKQPGEVFVHRNIANVLHASDLSSASVIEYGVKHLKVQHVVLCGHTSCGGVAAALGNDSVGILDPWLAPIRSLREQHARELAELSSPAEKNRRLVDLNVLRGVRVLKENSAVIQAIKERGLEVHGAVFDISTGVLEELDTKEQEDKVSQRNEAFILKA